MVAIPTFSIRHFIFNAISGNFLLLLVKFLQTFFFKRWEKLNRAEKPCNLLFEHPSVVGFLFLCGDSATAMVMGRTDRTYYCDV